MNVIINIPHSYYYMYKIPGTLLVLVINLYIQLAVYCLNYDAGAQSKDIHATMTDKCCQARSRTRGFQ